MPRIPEHPMRVTLVLLALQAGSVSIAQPGPPPAPPACAFADYLRHELVTSWEMQLDVPPERCEGRQRAVLLGQVTAMLAEMESSLNSLRVAHHTLRTSVFDQVSHAVSTTDGKPLFPGKDSPQFFPWRGPAFVRHRRKHAMQCGMGNAGRNASLQLPPQHADLTLKVKDIDLEAFHLLHRELDFPSSVERMRAGREARLKWKVENDRYCAVGRASYEAKFSPVSQRLATSRLKDLNKFFPGLAAYMCYSPKSKLPVYGRRAFSKSVWDVSVGGVPGVANWIISYRTLLDALAGAPTGRACELSLRLKRRDAESGGDGAEPALDALAGVMQAMHDAGWDTGVHGAQAQGRDLSGGGASMRA